MAPTQATPAAPVFFGKNSTLKFLVGANLSYASFSLLRSHLTPKKGVRASLSSAKSSEKLAPPKILGVNA